VSPTFWITTFVVVATPGTGVVYTLSAALSRGARAGLVAAVGCTLGIVPHVLAAVTGLAAIMHASAVAFQGLKLAGVVYLLFLAWATLRERGDLTVDPDRPGDPDGTVDRERTGPSAGRVVARGVLVNVLNPKLTLFFFAFLPQFVGGDRAGSLPLLLELSAVFMIVTLVVFAGYGLAAAAVRQQVLERPHVVRRVRRAFAASYLALAGRLALAQRS